MPKPLIEKQTYSSTTDKIQCYILALHLIAFKQITGSINSTTTLYWRTNYSKHWIFAYIRLCRIHINGTSFSQVFCQMTPQIAHPLALPIMAQWSFYTHTYISTHTHSHANKTNVHYRATFKYYSPIHFHINRQSKPNHNHKPQRLRATQANRCHSLNITIQRVTHSLTHSFTAQSYDDICLWSTLTARRNLRPRLMYVGQTHTHTHQVGVKMNPDDEEHTTWRNRSPNIFWSSFQVKPFFLLPETHIFNAASVK